MPSLEDNARLTGEALSERWPGAGFYVTTQRGSDGGVIVIEWTDAPRTPLVRQLARDVTCFSTSKEPGWKFAFRHRISRPLRLLVREVILAQYPAYDYITESGDLNPDSIWRYMTPDIIMPGEGLGDDEVIVCKDQDANSMIKLIAYALLRREGVKDV